MKPKEFLYLIYYSISSFFTDMFEMVAELKNPKTWSYIIFAGFMVAAYFRQYTIMMYLIPALFVVKIIRDRLDGRYRHEIFIRHVRKRYISELVLEYYKNYRKKCQFTHKHARDFDDWLDHQYVKLKNNTESES